MFDIGWSELLVVGVVALVVIGPKELPRVLRTVGQGVNKLRRMAGEFQGQFNEALREAELTDLKDSVSGLKNDLSGLASDARNSISNALPTNPLQDIATDVKAPTGSVERTDLPAADALADQLPPPGDLDPHPFETIEQEVRAATAAVEPAKLEPAKAAAAPAVSTPASPAAATAAPTVASDEPAKPKRVRAATPAATGEDAAAPKKPTVRRVAKKPAAEPEVAEAVAALDAPATPATPVKPKAPPKPRIKAKPGTKTEPTSGNEGPAA
ncbi:Sec-independent protein translocase protein TatB [Starkeya koreensis]|uniref:Sec-independent protein translocase protein TatB n=1 Tax=Ancylobacter koreensis TaxID=266121 RepID=A0ABT0DM69_9HYPH|nr:Sec-independent protein translocase protein TatB [Ancylobacter koreensis]MCK0208380.1 Sec-independent protein translocase protein TatB [Ancylobacter koreensis]